MIYLSNALSVSPYDNNYFELWPLVLISRTLSENIRDYEGDN